MDAIAQRIWMRPVSRILLISLVSQYSESYRDLAKLKVWLETCLIFFI
jgi:hypothetical protein